jgi:hypothetical protein
MNTDNLYTLLGLLVYCRRKENEEKVIIVMDKVIEILKTELWEHELIKLHEDNYDTPIT